jgi:hypothetical protein
MEGFGDSGKKWMKGGFDAAIEFQPFADTLYSFRNSVLMPRLKRKLITRASIKWRQITGNKQKSEQLINKWFSRIDYNEYVDYVMANNLYPSEYKRFPGLTPSWDNTPRRGESGFLFRDANPTKYKEWLQFHYQNFVPPSPDENFVFINAWNEWAEGNHLEPDQKWGKQYLEATSEVINNA